MYIHDRARLIYLAHPRTASVATSEALQSIGFYRPKYESHGELVEVEHHTQLFDRQSPIKKRDRHKWITFTTVRNHYDTALSWAFRRYKKIDELTEYMLQTVMSKDNRWIKENSLWWLHCDDANYTMGYETLEEDLREVLEQHNLEVPKLDKVNVSKNRKGRHYKEFYTDAAIEYIENRFREELNKYEYTF